MLINSIWPCRVFILFPLSRLPAYNHGLTLGPGYALKKKAKKKKWTEPGVSLGKGTGKNVHLPPPRPPHLRSLVHRFTRRLFWLFHPLSYPESSGLLVSGGTIDVNSCDSWILSVCYILLDIPLFLVQWGILAFAKFKRPGDRRLHLYLQFQKLPGPP